MTWLEQQIIQRRRVLIFHGPTLIGKTTFIHFLPSMLSAQRMALTFSFSGLEDYSVNLILLYFIEQLQAYLAAQDLEGPEDIATTADAFIAINDLLIQIFRQRAGIELILVIDDFDALYQDSPEDMIYFLDTCQSLLARHENLYFVIFTKSTTLLFLRHPLLNTAPTQQISSLLPTDALQMITRPLEGVIRFDYGVPKRIAELNSNHPYYIGLFNQTLYNLFAREGWVNLRHLDETLSEVSAKNIISFQEIWLEASLVERAVLAAMGSVRGTHGIFTQQEIVALLGRRDKKANEKTIVTALEALDYRGVLVKMGALSYKFQVDLLRLWIQRHYELDTVLSQVIWSKPTSRSRPMRPTDSQTMSHRRRRSNTRRPTWLVIALAAGGLFILCIFTVALFFMGNILGVLATPTSPDSADSGVVTFDTTAEDTPTPALAKTATPTPPIVVVKSLPAVAFMARQNEEPWQINLMNVDGSEVTGVLRTDYDQMSPAWSLTGDIAFVTQRDGNREIYVMDTDGQNLRNFSDHAADDWTPAWSADGTQLAFSSNRTGNWEILITNTDGTDLRQVTNTGTGNISPAWSPDGQFLAFSSKRNGGWEIYSMRVDGTEPKQLTVNNVNDWAPIWSPQGDTIAYETTENGNVEIYVMSHLGGNPRNISNNPLANDHGPVWSPDGQRLIFYSNRAQGNWDIFSMNLNGQDVVNLTNTPNVSEQTPVWRP